MHGISPRSIHRESGMSGISTAQGRAGGLFAIPSALGSLPKSARLTFPIRFRPRREESGSPNSPEFESRSRSFSALALMLSAGRVGSGARYPCCRRSRLANACGKEICLAEGTEPCVPESRHRRAARVAREEGLPALQRSGVYESSNGARCAGRRRRSEWRKRSRAVQSESPG